MSKSEALLQKAEKQQPQSTLPVSNCAISADEVLALRCMARERQARPLALALTGHRPPPPWPTQPSYALTLMTSSHSPPPVTLTHHGKQCSVRPLACDCQAVKFEIASRMMRETLRSHGRPLSRQATPTLTLIPRPSPKPNPKPKPNLCPSPSASPSPSPSASPSPSHYPIQASPGGARSPCRKHSPGGEHGAGREYGAAG